MRNGVIRTNFKLVLDSKLNKGNILCCSEKKEINDILAGYYISDNVFYYLKKDDNKYLLGKRYFVKTKEVHINEEVLKDLNNLDFIKFKTFCKIMDYKEHLFDKEDLE